MVYSVDGIDIDLSKVIRLYPAAVIESDGDVAQMSLEWTELNKDKVKVLSFVLVFDYTQPSQKERDKKELHFASKDELIEAINEVAQFFQ